MVSRNWGVRIPAVLWYSLEVVVSVLVRNASAEGGVVGVGVELATETTLLLLLLLAAVARRPLTALAALLRLESLKLCKEKYSLVASELRNAKILSGSISL